MSDCRFGVSPVNYPDPNCADQPAHPRRLVSAFVVHCLDTMIPRHSMSQISSLYLASMAEQGGLSRPWSQTPKTGFVTRLNYVINCNTITAYLLSTFVVR